MTRDEDERIHGFRINNFLYVSIVIQITHFSYLHAIIEIVTRIIIVRFEGNTYIRIGS